MPEKKHAYLIMAHNEPEVFKTLVSLIDDKLNDLYIHIDSKYDKKKFQEITNKFVTKSDVFFVPSIDVYWGGVTQVKTELNILQFAVNNKVNYSFYHYLSGVDLPLTTNKVRYDFFESRTGTEFIEIQSKQMEKKWEKRAKYYWFFEKNSKKTTFKFLRNALVALQILLRVNRLKNDRYNLQYGSNWVSVTNKLATDILDCRNDLELFFDKTHCPDEFLFQTFVNSKKTYNLYCDSKGNYSNARYIDWEHGNSSGSPSVLTQTDIQYAQDNEAMFARKFSEKDLLSLRFIESNLKDV